MYFQFNTPNWLLQGLYILRWWEKYTTSQSRDRHCGSRWLGSKAEQTQYRWVWNRFSHKIHYISANITLHNHWVSYLHLDQSNLSPNFRNTYLPQTPLSRYTVGLQCWTHLLSIISSLCLLDLFGRKYLYSDNMIFDDYNRSFPHISHVVRTKSHQFVMCRTWAKICHPARTMLLGFFVFFYCILRL